LIFSPKSITLGAVKGMSDLGLAMCQRCDDFDEHALKDGDNELSLSDVLARLLTASSPKADEDFS
jgi:hypothetical protein